jgi:hypothetical protein
LSFEWGRLFTACGTPLCSSSPSLFYEKEGRSGNSLQRHPFGLEERNSGG